MSHSVHCTIEFFGDLFRVKAWLDDRLVAVINTADKGYAESWADQLVDEINKSIEKT